jgi:hypothetical protein
VKQVGIGRREFLKLFGTTIAATAINPLQAIVVDEDLYINRALGIAFTKPTGWYFMSIKQFSALKNEQILKDDEFTSQLRGADDPLVVMTKIDPARNKEIGPSITVYAEPFEYEEGESLLGLLPRLEKVYAKSLEQYRHVGKPVQKTISNCESVEFFSKFRFKTCGTSILTRNRSLMTVRDPHIYTFNMFDYPINSMDTQDEYDEFIKSIYYV